MANIPVPQYYEFPCNQNLSVSFSFDGHDDVQYPIPSSYLNLGATTPGVSLLFPADLVVF